MDGPSLPREHIRIANRETLSKKTAHYNGHRMTRPSAAPQNDINALTVGRLGVIDLPCPLCSSLRSTPAKQRKPVLRIWHPQPGLATFHCVRCGARGCHRDRSVPRPDLAALARAKAQADERQRAAVGERLHTARWLWSRRQPVEGTIAEHYLRMRGYAGPIPATLGFLPARGTHGPAMIAAFGFPQEPEPGVLAMSTEPVFGVHLTRLKPDGSGKAGTDADKIMIGASIGSPIVLAPANDLLALGITEGIEDGLSMYEATNRGAWVAGCASRLPALADAIPSYVECATIWVDEDALGERYSLELADKLDRRGITVELAAGPKAHE